MSGETSAIREEARESMSYAEAGVDIEAGNRLVDRIRPLSKETHRKGCMSGIGGFGALFDPRQAGYINPILVSSTDGVGTKLKLAFTTGIHNTIGIDLVAMCVNDLVVQGADPLFFLDYFACGSLDVSQAEEVIAGIAEGCKQAGCALIGGETAEMPDMYSRGEYDIAGFAVGAVEQDKLLPNSTRMQAGDIVLGLSSSGFHSNGFSLIRKLIDREELDIEDSPPFESEARSLASQLLTPTRIYVKSCLRAARDTDAVNAFAHITGGGLTENLPRILPEHLSVQIDLDSWELPSVFAWVQELGAIADSEMLRTFNCGIGMAVICPADEVAEVEKILEEEGESVFRIGQLRSRSDKDVVMYNGKLSASE